MKSDPAKRTTCRQTWSITCWLTRVAWFERFECPTALARAWFSMAICWLCREWWCHKRSLWATSGACSTKMDASQQKIPENRPTSAFMHGLLSNAGRPKTVYKNKQSINSYNEWILEKGFEIHKCTNADTSCSASSGFIAGCDRFGSPSIPRSSCNDKQQHPLPQHTHTPEVRKIHFICGSLWWVCM